MTAQIAIMNKNAVALATDSAVTTQNLRGVKIHNSANKLFTLSKYHPVGVMVHANADFMGYPWETLIKVYRQQLGNTSFATVAGYVQDFFRYLETQEGLFSASRQTDWFRENAIQYLRALNTEFTGKVRSYFEEHGNQLTDDDTKQLLADFISGIEQYLGSQKVVGCYACDLIRERFVDEASPIVLEVIADIFQELPMDDFLDRVLALTLRRFTTDSSVGYTGIVFAGFGDAEFLPVVESFWVDGIFGGILRHQRYEYLSGNMNESPLLRILPFAQSDSVYRFLQGVDPSYKKESDLYVDGLIAQIRTHVHSSIADKYDSNEARTEAFSALDGVIGAGRAQLLTRLESLKQTRFVDPVMDVVGSLPKEDLAAIAESLVNLTSFQRKILREAETVGGPIDVAVISKGDGFIWIKRKHYFERDLNPAFFANYYQGDGNDE